MKKLSVFAAIVLCSLISYSVNAQAFHKGAKVFSIGIGASNFIHFWGGDNDFYGYEYDNTFRRTTVQINLQGEFGVHDYVGVGFTTGLGFAGGSTYYYGGEINFPIGAVGNFHFWQLIDDKVDNDMHADKLDLYAGVSIGSGFAALFYDDTYVDEGSDLSALLFVGPHVGVRYYFTDSFGVNAETGYGKCWINAGIVFKID